jgi:alpha-tubulin suppressor-like RCC1 family protein
VRDVKQVAVGGAHALLLLEDGRLYAAGLNTSGQLGLGSTANALQLTFVMDGVAYVAAGETHSAVIKLDGSLWTFGDNSFGQLGDGTRTNRSTPVHVTTFGNKAYKVAAGYGHTVVVLHDLTTWSVGLNRDGQLGLGDTVNRLEFTKLED